jgi:hypothetical protein
MDKATLLDRVRRATERWPTMNPQEVGDLERIVLRMPVQDRFDALAEPFADPPDNAFLAQEYAGQLLMKTSPPCPHDLHAVLRRLLPKWNRSVEELPWYLARVFGHDAVVRSLEVIDRAVEVDRELTDTVRFWLSSMEADGGPG